MGKETSSWQKKFFFHEIGREGNPDSAFILLLASSRKRPDEAAEPPGANLFAELVDRYGRDHLLRNPREMVRVLVESVTSRAAEAAESKTELAAGFLHVKGRRAAAGSVGRLRAGFADRDKIVATSPLPDPARKKTGPGQVALDLGQTVECDLDQSPLFFIAPSSAMAVGDEAMRKFVWGFAAGPEGMNGSPPDDWRHFPCLVGRAEAGAGETEETPRKRRLFPARASRKRPDEGVPREGAPAPAAEKERRARKVYGPSQGELDGRGAIVKTAAWVGLIAIVAFVAIKFGLAGLDGDEAEQGASAVATEVLDAAPTAVPPAVEDAGQGDEGRAASRERTADEGAARDPGHELLPLWTLNLGGVLTSSPVDLGEALAFGSRAGVVHCLSKVDGSELWRFRGPDGFGSSPAAADGRLFIGCYDGSVFCLSSGDGSKIWSYGTGGRVVSSPEIAEGGKVILGSYDGYLYCLSSEGELLWRFNSGARVWSSPVSTGGAVFFGDVSGRIHCLELTGGVPLWSSSVEGSVRGSPAAAGGRVYFGSSGGEVTAFSAGDGAKLWTHEASSGVSSSIAHAAGAVYAGFEDGSFVRLSADGGEVVWRTALSAPVRSQPVEAGGCVAVTCYDGSVRLLDIATGATVDRYQMEGKIYATPLLASEILYFGNMRGKFAALRIASPDPR